MVNLIEALAGVTVLVSKRKPGPKQIFKFGLELTGGEENIFEKPWTQATQINTPSSNELRLSKIMSLEII